MGKREAYAGERTRTFAKLPGYKKLIAWQKGDDLALLVRRITASFDRSDNQLVWQMRGAAISVPANIAEGYCRVALGDYIRFCEIARGSLGELGTYIQHRERVGLIQGPDLAQLLDLYDQGTFFLNRLLQALRDKQKRGDWERGQPAVKETHAAYKTAPVMAGDLTPSSEYTDTA